jgi:hypothetical protein
MKKGTTKLIVVLLCLLSLACKKNNINTEEPAADKQLINSVNSWLDKKIEVTTNNSYKLRIKNLKSKILYNSLKIHSSSNNQKVYTFTLSGTTYPLEDSQDQLLIFNVDNDVIKSSFIIMSNSKVINSLDLTNLLTYKKNMLTAIVEVSTIYDKTIVKNEYENGVLKKSGVIRKKDENAVIANSQQSNCIDWYWLTTIYWADGTTSTTTEYAFTTCGCSDPLNESLGCPGSDGGIGNGGGGSDNQDYPEFVGATTFTITPNNTSVSYDSNSPDCIKEGLHSWTIGKHSLGSWSIIATTHYKSRKCAATGYVVDVKQFNHVESHYSGSNLLVTSTWTEIGHYENVYNNLTTYTTGKANVKGRIHHVSNICYGIPLTSICFKPESEDILENHLDVDF